MDLLSDSDELVTRVYDRLRAVAAASMSYERPDHTWQATELVHEAYLRLMSQPQVPQWNHVGHFVAAAAHAMRRILVEHARRRQRFKRGGDRVRLPLDEENLALPPANESLLALDEALSRLALEHPELAELVTLRFFGGLTMSESATSLNIKQRTAERDWTYAKAWLLRALQEPDETR